MNSNGNLINPGVLRERAQRYRERAQASPDQATKQRLIQIADALDREVDEIEREGGDKPISN